MPLFNTSRVRTLAAIVAIAWGHVARAAPGEVRESIPCPCKYPAGLASDGDRLLVADWRTAEIFALRPHEEGTPARIAAPTLKPHGLAFGDGRLYVSDDHTGGIFDMNLDTGVVENTFKAPADQATGLAYHNAQLFVLAKEKIYTVMPEDGTILRYYDAPTPTVRCLAHDGTYLWASDRVKNELYMVHPETGKVLGIVDAPGPYAAGIAWHQGDLWNVDFQQRRIHRIAVQDEPMYRLSDARRARVEYLWALSNYGPGEVNELALHVAIPVELPNQKLLSELRFSSPPIARAQDRWDQPCARFDLGPVRPGQKASLTYDVDAEVSAIRYLIIPDRVGTLDDIPADIREKYTVDASRYRVASPYIQETAKRIVGDEGNAYWIARKIYDFVIDSLEYEMTGGWDVPEVVLKRGSGSCSEYTYSFVALCRAAGLPARYQGSIVVRGDDASIDEAFHRWAQVYLPGYGWVPVDANRGDQKVPAEQARGIGELANRFLITTQGGGDSEYLSWGYNSFSRYTTIGYCNVTEDQFGLWEPLEQSKSEPVAVGKDACGQ